MPNIRLGLRAFGEFYAAAIQILSYVPSLEPATSRREDLRTLRWELSGEFVTSSSQSSEQNAGIPCVELPFGLLHLLRLCHSSDLQACRQ